MTNKMFSDPYFWKSFLSVLSITLGYSKSELEKQFEESGITNFSLFLTKVKEVYMERNIKDFLQ